MDFCVRNKFTSLQVYKFTVMSDVMDIVESRSTAEESAQPASSSEMVVGRESQPLLPGNPPAQTDVSRRLQNDSPHLEAHHSGIPIQPVHFQGEADVQEQDLSIENMRSPVTELGCNIPYSQQCTEDTAEYFQYMKGNWSKGCIRVERKDWWENTCIGMDGKYWFMETSDYIGKGASGSCYKVMHPETKPMVVKQISSVGKEDDVDSEINIMNYVHHHPNMVSFFGATRDHHYTNIFMEWVKGGSLEAILKRDGRFNEDIIWRYTRQVVCGLQFLHSLGIAHRDLKCANILLDPDLQTIRIADFGTAARLTEAKKFYITAGTPPFMAPEVVRASVDAGYGLECDVWSLGCVGIEMFTGKHPWVPLNNIHQIFFKLGQGVPPKLPDFHSARLRNLVVSCLQVNPNDRPTSLELWQDYVTDH